MGGRARIRHGTDQGLTVRSRAWHAPASNEVSGTQAFLAKTASHQFITLATDKGQAVIVWQ